MRCARTRAGPGSPHRRRPWSGSSPARNLVQPAIRLSAPRRARRSRFRRSLERERLFPRCRPEERSPAVSTAGGSRSPAAFKTGVTYVSLPVSVTDGEGRAVVDLDPSLFRIYEDDTPQVIDRVVSPWRALQRGASYRHIVQHASQGRGDARGDRGGGRCLQPHRCASDGVVRSACRVALDTAGLPRSTPPGYQRTVTRCRANGHEVLRCTRSPPLRSVESPFGSNCVGDPDDGVDTASRLADAETARRRLGESHIPVYVIHYDTSQDDAPARSAPDSICPSMALFRT